MDHRACKNMRSSVFIQIRSCSLTLPNLAAGIILVLKKSYLETRKVLAYA